MFPSLTRPFYKTANEIARLRYEAGESLGLMFKAGGDAVKVHALSGELYASGKWVLLRVPNALVRGAFDALDEQGAQLPLKDGKLNAHISVIRPEELEQIGGAAKISERGHHFRYTLGPVKEVEPPGWPEMSKVWFIEVKSPELENLRKSYGLANTPKNGESQFHITIGLRKKSVLKPGETTKHAAWGDGDPRFGCTCPRCGSTKTSGARAMQTARDGNRTFANAVCGGCGDGFSYDFDNRRASIAETGRFKKAEARGPEGEYCPSCDARLERDPYSGTCNRCGKKWPEKSAVEKMAALLGGVR